MKNLINNKGNILGAVAMVLAVASTIVNNYNSTRNMEDTIKREVEKYMKEECNEN